MKSLREGLIISMLLIVSVALMAQGPGGKGGPGGPGGMRMGMSVTQMKKVLNLTDEQATKIEALQKTYTEKNKTVMEEMSGMMDGFGAKPDPNSEEFKTMQIKMAGIQEKIQANIVAYEKELKTILTKEQSEIYDNVKIENNLLGRIGLTNQRLETFAFTDTQKVSYKALVDKYVKILKVNTTGYNKAVDEYKAELAKDKTSEATKNKLAAANTIAEKNKKDMDAFTTEFKSLLTDAQLTKYTELTKRSQKGGPGGPGGPGPGPGGPEE